MIVTVYTDQILVNHYHHKYLRSIQKMQIESKIFTFREFFKIRGLLDYILKLTTLIFALHPQKLILTKKTVYKHVRHRYKSESHHH